jgi:preprotein translocase subunit SecD
MNKRTRFLIILVVIGVCFAFLWPTVQWYMIVKPEQQALALGSREQIKDYATRMASTELKALKDLAVSKPDAPIVGDFGFLIDKAKANYRTSKRPFPGVWSAKAVLSAFATEKEAFDLIEGHYRSTILDLKALHGSAVQLGLDLSGGMSVIIQANLDSVKQRLGHDLSAAEKQDAMNRAIEILKSRIDKFGLTEPVIRQQGETQIYVEIPGAADPERIKSIIMGKGNLSFHIVDDDATAKFLEYYNQHPTDTFDANGNVIDPNIVPVSDVVRGFYTKDKYGLDEFTRYMVIQKEVGLDGNHIQSATTNRDSITQQPEVNFQLDKQGGEMFYKLTGANVNKTLCVVMDDKVRSGARIQEPIRDSVRITGFNTDDATNLALILRSAALPVELDVVNQSAIGSTLGEDAIRQGLQAVTIAFVLVIGFMLLYYLGSGINAALAQLLNLYMMFAVLSAFSLTLTLPTIAGFVLTIGMSVDANVLIFERMKEEMRLGKGRKSVIDAGFHHAFWTIFDSHTTTLIAALFLSQLGTGPIQGFAVSLAIGTLSSLFTALVVSRLLFDFETDVLHVKKVSISWRTK